LAVNDGPVAENERCEVSIFNPQKEAVAFDRGQIVKGFYLERYCRARRMLFL
jgi:hypothetical protein